MKTNVFILLIVAGLLLLAACTGEDGPAGLDGSSIDAIPPTVVLEFPTPGLTIGNSFTATASAIDNAGIDKIHFLLDGSDQINDTTFSVVFEEPYLYEYNFDLMTVSNGPHTFQVKAYDLQGNFASSPPIIFNIDFLPPEGVGVLRHWDPDSLNAVTIPNREIADQESRHFIRFDIDRTCIVDSVRIYFDSLATETMNYDRDVLVELFNSNGVYPTTIIKDDASTTLTTTELSQVGFHKADFSGQDTLYADNRYHVVFYSDAASDTTNMAVGTYVRDHYPFDTDNNSGIGFTGDGLNTDWETYQEYSIGGEKTIEYLVELWVRYL